MHFQKTFEIILFVGLAQGVFLAFSIASIKRNNRVANRLMLALIILTTLSILGHLMMNSEMTSIVKLGSFLQVTLLFLFGSILLLYSKALLFTTKEKVKWTIFIPKLIHLFILSLFIIKWPTKNQANLEIWLCGLLEALAIIHVFYFTIKTFEVFTRYQNLVRQEKSSLPSLRYLKTLVIVKLICLVFWSFAFIFSRIFPTSQLNFLFYSIVWIVPTLIVFALGFFAIWAPEIFRVVELKKKEAPKVSIDIGALYKRLQSVMENNKPYLDHDISINQLAEKVGITVSELSATITERSGYNFFDFVNSYRITEFSRLALNPKNNHLTLLAIAFEAGFNSKTAFNNAFKRITGATPTQYMNAKRKDSGVVSAIQ